MQTVGVNIVPIFCGYEMAERISVSVHCNLGVARCARSKEHEHRIIAECAVLGRRSVINIAELAVFLIEIMPALTLAVSNYPCFKNRAFFRRKLNLMSNVSVSSADNCADLTCIESVFKIVVNKLICCGNNDCADLMERKNREPELIMALENKHYPVALFDAERAEIIGCH